MHHHTCTIHDFRLPSDLSEPKAKSIKTRAYEKPTPTHSMN